MVNKLVYLSLYSTSSHFSTLCWRTAPTVRPWWTTTWGSPTGTANWDVNASTSILWTGVAAHPTTSSPLICHASRWDIFFGLLSQVFTDFRIFQILLNRKRKESGMCLPAWKLEHLLQLVGNSATRLLPKMKGCVSLQLCTSVVAFFWETLSFFLDRFTRDCAKLKCPLQPWLKSVFVQPAPGFIVTQLLTERQLIYFFKRIKNAVFYYFTFLPHRMTLNRTDLVLTSQ